MKKLTVLFALLAFTSLTMLAQTVQIRGKVTSSEDGLPLPGVAVTVPGTTIGVSTASDGSYTIQAPANATALEFQFIGMKKAIIEIQGRTTIDVAMEPDRMMMDEVIVTAIGIERKTREIGYSMTKIDGETLNQAKGQTIAGGLVGKIAGLSISTVSSGVNPDQRVILRGNRSLTGNNQALVVLDGVPVALSYLLTLNPNDVADISVLKGANASALYGSDASNGVIMVTTRKGSRDRISVEVSNTTTFDKVAFFPQLQERFGAGSSSDVYGNPVYEPYENQQYGPEFDGTPWDIGRPDEYGRVQSVPFKALPREKYNFFDTGLTMQNDISFSAGNNNSQYYVSAQDARVKGLLPGDQLRRNAVRFNGSSTYGGFKASTNVSYTHTEDDVTTSNILWSVYNTPQNIPLTRYRDWRTPSTAEVTNWADINHYFNDYYDNPYTQADKNRRLRKRDYVIGTLSLSQEITDWLKAEARTAVSFNYSSSKSTVEAWDYSDWAVNDSNRSSAGGGDSPSSVSDAFSYGFRWTNDFILTANKEFGLFNVTAIGGATTRSTYSNSLSVSVSALEVPDVYNINNRVGLLSGSQGYTQARTMGVFGDVTLGYRNFLFLHASGRNDWDSRLDPSNWSFFYPGIDASFVFTEAIPALAGNRILTYGKLRGGIAKVGSININAYDLENEFSVASGFPYGDITAHSISSALKNRFLQPEFTVSKEIGVDLNFFNSRINTEIAVYSMSTTNQTLPAQIAYSSGYASMYVNAGEMVNKGFEIELKTVPVFKGNIRWDVNLNYAYWFNEVISLTDEFSELSLGNYVYAIEGYPYPVNKWSDFERDPQGRVIVDAKTGLPTKSTDLPISGQTVPKHLLGLQTYLKYKGFTFGASAEYRGGHIARSGTASDMMFTGISEITASAGRERFVYPNSVINVGTAEAPEYVPNTNITVNNGNVDFWTQTYRSISRAFVHNAAFWKIREMSLYYDVPKSILTYTGDLFKGARIGFVGRNLFMFLPKSNMYGDPEVNSGSGNAVGYSPSGAIPPTRSYGFNITLTF
ncbi:MAG: SusC/RagA family TonB-linked outer membrane protein [Bacteroidales bacterium]|nr:SusC/RagA family TonB-linked outer membrane protein [Bacteroidales bacterium]